MGFSVLCARTRVVSLIECTDGKGSMLDYEGLSDLLINQPNRWLIKSDTEFVIVFRTVISTTLIVTDTAGVAVYFGTTVHRVGPAGCFQL